MIRFRCRECGKKLKAEEDIVGRKVKCTRCKNIETVPPEDRLDTISRREAEENNDVIRADSDDDFDFTSASESGIYADTPGEGSKSDSRLSAAKPDFEKNFQAMGSSVVTDEDDDEDDEFDDQPIIALRENTSGRSSKSLLNTTSDGDSDSESSIDLPHPTAGFARKKKDNSRRNIALALSAVLAAIVIGFSWSAISTYLNRPFEYSDDFLKCREVFDYQTAIEDVNKSKRVMRVMGEAFVASNGASDLVLEDMNDYIKKVEEQTEDESILKSAYTMYVSNQPQKAKNNLVDATEKLKLLKAEIEEMSEKYQGAGPQLGE